MESPTVSQIGKNELSVANWISFWPVGKSFGSLDNWQYAMLCNFDATFWSEKNPKMHSPHRMQGSMILKMYTQQQLKHNIWPSIGSQDCQKNCIAKLLFRSPLCTTAPDCDNDCFVIWFRLANYSRKLLILFPNFFIFRPVKLATDILSVVRKCFYFSCKN